MRERRRGKGKEKGRWRQGYPVPEVFVFAGRGGREEELGPKVHVFV